MAENMKMHRDCDVHEAVNCDINDHKNLEPGLDDCGHRIEAGPGVQGYADLNTYEKGGKGAIVAGMPKHNLDQDVANGPGHAGVGDLNIYETDKYGRKMVVAGSPNHNMDQDVEHGPGVK